MVVEPEMIALLTVLTSAPQLIFTMGNTLAKSESYFAGAKQTALHSNPEHASYHHPIVRGDYFIWDIQTCMTLMFFRSLIFARKVQLDSGLLFKLQFFASLILHHSMVVSGKVMQWDVRTHLG